MGDLAPVNDKIGVLNLRGEDIWVLLVATEEKLACSHAEHRNAHTRETGGEQLLPAKLVH